MEAGATGRETVLFLDLDGFKGVNDELGHAAGDEVLVVVAQRIRAQVSARDLAARFGGDEFAVLLSDVAESDIALAIAQRIMNAVSQPLTVEGQTVQISGSIGVAIPESGATELAVLLRQADKALYEAKRAGKACIRLHEPAACLRAGQRVATEAAIPEPRDVSAVLVGES